MSNPENFDEGDTQVAPEGKFKAGKRQGLIVTIEQLRKLADELDKEVKDNEKKYKTSGWGTLFQINIINKEGLSDTWEIEE